MPPLETGNEDEIEQPAHIELMIIRQALGIQPKENGDEVQRENPRCHVNKKVCNMIINNWSYINMASTLFVKKPLLPP